MGYSYIYCKNQDFLRLDSRMLKIENSNNKGGSKGNSGENFRFPAAQTSVQQG
jgi:hypothetical protein